MSDLTGGRVQDDLKPRQWSPANIQWWYPRFVCLGVLTIVVGAIWGWQHRNDAVRTTRLELIGPDGNVCAVMGTVPGSGTGLSLQDSRLRTRATLTVTPLGNPRLSLHGEDGTTRAGMDVAANGQSTLRLFNKDGAVRLAMTVKPDGSSTVEVTDINGKCISSFTLDGGQKPKPADMNRSEAKTKSPVRPNQDPPPSRLRKPLAITEGSERSEIHGPGAVMTRMVD